MSIPTGFRFLSLPISQLNLSAVLKCGQSFRWQATELPIPHSDPPSLAPSHEWRLALADRVVLLRQTPSAIYYSAVFPEALVAARTLDEIEDTTLAWLRDYFQLSVDLAKLYDFWSEKDEIFKGKAARFSGIRILRQDPWENLISFICSQNNHISRITSMVQKLCTHFSPPLLSYPLEQGVPHHPFPTPQSLSHPSVEPTLRELGFGYRAKYIQRTAALLSESHQNPNEFFEGLRKANLEDARTELLKLHGVGPKVADCILLMSLDKPSVVPVDTHVYQIAVRHYGLRAPSGKSPAMTPKIYADVANRLQNVWGPYAGWAHSVLFTSDLRSFSNYGLPTPSPSTPSPSTPSEATPKRKKSSLDIFIPTPSTTPTPTPTHRRRRNVIEPATPAPAPAVEDPSVALIDEAAGSLAERVKRRRRR